MIEISLDRVHAGTVNIASLQPSPMVIRKRKKNGTKGTIFLEKK